MEEVVIGIDLGTQGIRALAVYAGGRVAAEAHVRLPDTPGGLPAGWSEQDPREWRRAMMVCLRALTGQLPGQARMAGVCIDSTSGTILPVDAVGNPLHNALMYNDQRSEGQVPAVRTAGADLQAKLGYVFGSSYALPKLLWLRQERPEVYERTAKFLHAADYLSGCLTGHFDLSDTSNALKTGYDLIDLTWPDFIEHSLGIELARLPQVLLPGEQFGEVSQPAAEESGLSVGTPVYAGATDGTAAQLASGAALPGDWNSTLGTTLVFKGISSRLLPDPLGWVYYHRHPEGWWMPGGASNTGTEWILCDHPGEDLDLLNRGAEARLPTDLLRYPLAKRGERFPFMHSGAEGFILGASQDPLKRFAAGLEGLAFVERLAYDVLARIGLEVGPRVYITGGGTRSPLWSRLRASILGKILVQPMITETAMGAAVLAAAGCWYGSASRSAAEMVQRQAHYEPELVWESVYSDRYAGFLAELERRGYLRGETR
jgi:D-ribulokinase